MRTGPGVDDRSITLGLVVDSGADRGFSAGVRLWQATVNRTTGICGRTVEIASPATGSGEAADNAMYTDVGRDTLGLITLPAAAAGPGLAARIAGDQIPSITPGGRSADLSPNGPMVIGATDDILAINAAAHLVQSGVLETGGTLGVATDDSAEAADGLAGLRWFADRAGVGLDVRSGESVAAGWSGAPAVVVLGGPDVTNRVLLSTPADLTVVTTLDGYDPTTFQPSWTGRLLVSAPTTAVNSDHPGAEAVAKAFSAAGGSDPGPLLFAGYAVGATWARLLDQACTAANLTREGIRTAAAGLAPASPDSLLGATNLNPLVTSGLPATRVSAISTADPSAPGGLAALTWLQSAPGISDYVPDR